MLPSQCHRRYVYSPTSPSDGVVQYGTWQSPRRTVGQRVAGPQTVNKRICCPLRESNCLSADQLQAGSLAPVLRELVIIIIVIVAR